MNWYKKKDLNVNDFDLEYLMQTKITQAKFGFDCY